MVAFDPEAIVRRPATSGPVRAGRPAANGYALLLILGLVTTLSCDVPEPDGALTPDRTPVSTDKDEPLDSRASGASATDSAPRDPAAGTPASEPKKAPAPGGVEGIVRYTFDAAKPWRYGRYYVDGRKAGPLAEAVIALEASSRKLRRPPSDQTSTVVVDQKDHAFVPETVAVRVRDSVRFTNSDFTLHNVHSLSPLLTFNTNVPSGDGHAVTCTKAGGIDRPALIGCHLHSSMRGWIYIFDHPFFQVTARDGRFRLGLVPAGRYDLVLVHPAGRLRWRRQVDVEQGRTRTVEIALSPEHFEEF